MNCWTILQIEPTKDLKEIKHAYAVLTKQYHPEDDPEKFEEIQEAYQKAVAYAKDNSQIAISRNTPLFSNKEKALQNISLSSNKEKTFQTEETISNPDDETPDDYYENLFESHKEEMQDKIKEQGMFFKHKISFLVSNSKVGTLKAWRDVLRREEFKLAVYDSSFICELTNYLKDYGVPVEILFEIYYYFIKNKKERDWDDNDIQLNRFFLDIFYKKHYL